MLRWCALGVMMSAGGVAAQPLGPCDIVVKDTLTDPANWSGTFAGGGFVDNLASANDTRSFIGVSSPIDSCLRSVSFYFTIWDDIATFQPIVGDPGTPIRQISIDTFLYADFQGVLNGATDIGDITPAAQLEAWWTDPVGQSVAGLYMGFLVEPGSVFGLAVDVTPLAYMITRNQVHFLGVTIPATPPDRTLYLQRSLDSGESVGSLPDYHLAEGLIEPTEPLSVFYPDATQNATRIVVAPCDGTCCPADRSTSGALSEADPGWGVPDGVLDQSDLDYFLDQHATALAGGINVIQVDRNEDGTVDAADIAEFQAQLAAGCGDTCPADTNNDGLLTPADFNAWILAFNSGAPECDQNADGLCTPADFNAWILNFNAGC